MVEVSDLWFLVAVFCSSQCTNLSTPWLSISPSVLFFRMLLSVRLLSLTFCFAVAAAVTVLFVFASFLCLTQCFSHNIPSSGNICRMKERLTEWICLQLKRNVKRIVNAFFPTVRPPWPVPFNDICIDNKDLFRLKPQLDLFVLIKNNFTKHSANKTKPVTFSIVWMFAFHLRCAHYSLYLIKSLFPFNYWVVAMNLLSKMGGICLLS